MLGTVPTEGDPGKGPGEKELMAGAYIRVEVRRRDREPVTRKTRPQLKQNGRRVRASWVNGGNKKHLTAEDKEVTGKSVGIRCLPSDQPNETRQTTASG